MLPLRVESSRTKRNSRRKPFSITIVIAIVIIAGLSYQYGESIYLSLRQRFMPGNLQLLESRSNYIDQSLIAHSQLPIGFSNFSSDERSQLLAYLADSRRILKFYESSNQEAATLQAYGAFFEFSELLFYVELNQESLLQLTGPGILPPIKHISIEAFREKVKHSAIFARKSLAIDPSQQKSELILIEILSDLLFNERIDPYLYERLAMIDKSKVKPSLQPVLNYTMIALSAQKGDIQTVNSLIQDNFDKDIQLLLRVYTQFHGRDYIQSIQNARLMLSQTSMDANLRSEAARMIAEIFAIQSGPAAGLPYLRLAQDLREQPNPLLTEQIQRWQNNQK